MWRWERGPASRFSSFRAAGLRRGTPAARVLPAMRTPIASCPGRRLAAAALLLAVAGGSRLLAEAGPLFAVRPAWWDTAIPKAPPAAQLADPAAAWSALQSTNNPWQRAFDGWRLAAPFDGRAGRGMDDLLPP